MSRQGPIPAVTSLFQKERVMYTRQQLINRNKQQQPDKSRPVPTIHCIECFKPVTGVPYSFAGGLACERCVRTYCRKNGYTDVQLELRERAAAAEWIIRDFERSNKAR